MGWRREGVVPHIPFVNEDMLLMLARALTASASS